MKWIDRFQRLFRRGEPAAPLPADIEPTPAPKSKAERDAEWQRIKTVVEGKPIAPLLPLPASTRTGPSSFDIVALNIAARRVKDLSDGRPMPSQMKSGHAPASKSRYPMLRLDMIDSSGKPITSAQAVKLFKNFTVTVGYLDKDEVDQHATYFAEHMKEEAMFLSDEVAHAMESSRDEIADAKKEIASLKRQLSKATTETERTQITTDLADAEFELEEQMKATIDAQKAQAAFKADKRNFLVHYVNSQTQR